MQIVLIVLFLIVGSIANAVDLIPKPGAVPVEWDSFGNPIYLMKDLRKQEEHLLSPMLYNGTKSIEGEFPEVGWIGNCTATAVGPKVIFTAAHCQRTGTRINFKMRKDQVSYPATCYRHPQYNDRTVFNDYAVCVLDGQFPSGTKFASFTKKLDFPEDGFAFLANGYGAPNLGTHYHGRANKKDNDNQDIVTCGPSNLGGGDSGGSLFAFTDDRNNPEKHEIFAPNSRAGGGCSYFNAVYQAYPWLKSFAVDKGVAFCGLTIECGSSEPPPPGICIDEQNVVNYLQKLLDDAKGRLAMCRAQ